jgi:pilus assembly protein CpaF
MPANPNCFIITCVGARDGVGKTVFATNIALSFQRETRRRVLLVDLDPIYCGDIGTLLAQTAAKTIAELAPVVDRAQASLLKGFVTPHASGIHVLPLYKEAKELGATRPDAVGKTLDLLSELYDFIIVDVGTVVNDLTVKALERSTAIFIVTTPDVMVLQQSRRLVEQLQNMHFPKEMLKVILNKFEPKGAIPLEVIIQKLQRQILTAIVRDDALVTQSVNMSQPFVLAAPRAIITKNYDDLARNLLERGILANLRAVEKPKDLQIGDGGAGGAPAIARGPAVFKATPSPSGDRFSKRGSKQIQIDPRTVLKQKIHKRLIEVLDLKRLDQELKGKDNKEELLRERTEQAIIAILDQDAPEVRDREERKGIVREVLNEALGLGCLEDLLADESVTEVMVNGPHMVFVEKQGKLQLSDVKFTDEGQLRAVIERIVAPIGRRIDEKSPYVDARLRDGSRVHAIIPPLSIDGSTLTIRKFSKTPYTYKDLIKFGSMQEEIADFLRACVEARLNIVISGGTGSGKTTLLNVLSSFIPNDERIITVEDSAELQLPQEHVIRLETRPKNIEGEGEVTIRDLVRNTLRMRPDRIVVGECRSGEALDMLQAMNTGHDGSLTTVHSNSPRDCLARLETLVMFAGLDMPSRAIREQISGAINMIIQQSRMSDGTRKITYITEVTGMEGQVITMQDIFVYKQTGVDERGKVVGKFVSTGFIPRFVEGLQARGIKLPKGIFREG